MDYVEINKNLQLLEVCAIYKLKTESESFYVKVFANGGISGGNSPKHTSLELKVDTTEENLEKLKESKKFTIVVNCELEIPVDEYVFEQHITLT